MATAELHQEEETLGRILTEVGLANNRDVQLWKANMIAEDKVRRVRRGQEFCRTIGDA